ncbi:hypothetical protein A2U01_0086845, partial [Trifolium medium]|nr:hypothetical protein [Trifolium medium]
VSAMRVSADVVTGF